MHLLAAQPGGFVDDEGIVDLQQSPGDLVILAAADTSLAALSAGVSRFSDALATGVSSDKHEPRIRLANWMQLLKPAAYDLYESAVLEETELVVVSLLGGQSYWPYGFERLQRWSEGYTSKGKKRQLILVPGDNSPDLELFGASNVAKDICLKVWAYLRQGGVANSENLLRFLMDQLLLDSFLADDRLSDRSPARAYLHAWQEPQMLPNALVYQEADTPSDQPVCVLLFYRSHLQSANTQVFDQFLALLRQQGLNPLAVAVSSLKDAESLTLVNQLVEAHNACLILNSTSFASNRVQQNQTYQNQSRAHRDILEQGVSSEPTLFDSPFERQIPVLQLILSSSTQEDWQQYSQGLRSRDIAMQVVLPEMDGRIISRAISFKAQSHFDERCQLPVVRYQLHQERATFVAQLAKAYCRLGAKANKDKRIALILANYPTKDGRIGNGVGLDTPQSMVNILRALAEAGYPLPEHDLPQSGTELIEWLLESVTNNPNTLHQLPCWQSMALNEYQQYFEQLPEANQQAVLQRWGMPQQDIKYRAGRLMLSGLRLGDVFIGIQPARGFNIDLVANYHDPDLVPPHSYLAFYFWLRHCYQVDAVVHVGKHGNLEWLPGKGTALSAQCWPDIALGPLPHFYPFIVNDPGEGAQAKRRTQGVIIDHLMPPMTRAESYGELAELENLVDEYYQALGMDQRREDWLKQEILKQVQSSHLLEELGLNISEPPSTEPASIERLSTKGVDDNQVLEQLDAYLCEIKEAQIRHGLHILGQLPERDKLADTLVALLRLPRGSTPESQGILHNLSQDLGLAVTQADGGIFNPLKADAEPWLGAKPDILVAQSTRPWRTRADTRERLELLALALIQRYLLDDDSCSNSDTANGFSLDLARLPRTAQQFEYVENRLFKALQQSAHLELHSLVSGLNGQFVPPGPSGAPTRGRLDTLPTGRNFFSLDSRAIPSPAAWAIGERSAEALIQRHLQEQGDYPKQLGLSVWGTATMRTGGDDIAQAFALMGIRPVWASGSNRVVDFEIVSCLRLGRPRVDVTLRVSGFFRDAFPNVMKLYDAAVQALVDYQEAGNGNTIKAHIVKRQQGLIAEGLSSAQALRQASYRVFGSKPGAYGAGLQGLIDERCWEKKSDLAEAYLNWGGYAYGSGTDEDSSSDQPSGDGVAAHQAFEYRLSQLEAVVQNQDNREHDLLDSDDYYQFQGGMSNAVTVYSGTTPQVYHGDHSNPADPNIRTLKEELNRVIRSRVLNPKWINGMREHGYKGAFEMAASVDYLFAYDATTDLIDDYQYEKVADALVLDTTNQAFLQEHNPNALEEMAERLMEAIQRGQWQQPEHYQQQLQQLLLALDEAREGLSSIGKPELF
jgi:cobaltochelatase CobN